MSDGLILRDGGAGGWIEPYLAGLRQGRAIAAQCTCGRVSLPPERTCPLCRNPVAQWVTLPSTATLIHRATGADGDVALVRLDGATTASVAVLQGFTAESIGRVVAAPADRPYLILAPVRP